MTSCRSWTSSPEPLLIQARELGGASSAPADPRRSAPKRGRRGDGVSRFRTRDSGARRRTNVQSVEVGTRSRENRPPRGKRRAQPGPALHIRAAHETDFRLPALNEKSPPSMTMTAPPRSWTFAREIFRRLSENPISDGLGAFRPSRPIEKSTYSSSMPSFSIGQLGRNSLEPLSRAVSRQPPTRAPRGPGLPTARWRSRSRRSST